jgi:calcineurin-like phosphoesterase family protein
MPWLTKNPVFDPTKSKHTKYNNPWIADLSRHDAEIIQNHNNMVQQGDLVYVLGDFAWRDHSHYFAKLNGKHIITLGNHDKMNETSLRNFTEVHEMGCRKRIAGHDITMSHYAMRSWPSSCHQAFHAYGHSHGRMPEFENMLCCDVGIDVWGYAPVPWTAFLYKMQLKIEWSQQHHNEVVDGESRAEGVYDKSPEQRVIEIRRKNKALMREMGYPIDDRMWPECEGI